MKLATINKIDGVLAELKINKISDSSTKKEIQRTYLSVRKAMRPFEKDRDEMIDKFRSDWKDEIMAISEKRYGDYSACLAADQDLGKAIEKMLNENEAEIEFSPVNAEWLYAPELWDNDVTLGGISKRVAFLVKHGIAEE